MYHELLDDPRLKQNRNVHEAKCGAMLHNQDIVLRQLALIACVFLDDRKPLSAQKFTTFVHMLSEKAREEGNGRFSEN